MSQFTAPSIVVGIDGSRAGVQAAVWAVEEAVGRNLPLRLVGVHETGEDATGQALHEAADAVAATGRKVQVTTETLTGTVTSALLEASSSAAMICVGSVGLKHFEHGRADSTARALAAAAHCPVAIVRTPSRAGTGSWVAVELSDTPESAAVLQFGVEEARLRKAALRAIWPRQSRRTDASDPQAVTVGNRTEGNPTEGNPTEGDRTVRIRLDRRLTEWKHRYPDLDVAPVAVHGTALDYLADHADDLQLVVVGARNTASVDQLLGPAGLAALHNTSVLVVDQQRLL